MDLFSICFSLNKKKNNEMASAYENRFNDLLNSINTKIVTNLNLCHIQATIRPIICKIKNFNQLIAVCSENGKAIFELDKNDFKNMKTKYALQILLNMESYSVIFVNIYNNNFLNINNIIIK